MEPEQPEHDVPSKARGTTLELGRGLDLRYRCAWMPGTCMYTHRQLRAGI